MELSKRMQQVADYVQRGAVVADIGTDHAYLPIALVQNGKIKKAIAIDVKRGPYENARSQVERFGVREQVEVRLGDGLRPLQLGEVDTVVLAGIGGALMLELLAARKELVKGLKHIITQPQNGLAKIRSYLIAEGWKIVEECLLEDDGIYTVMRWEQGDMQKLSWLELELGPLILEGKGALLEPFLSKKLADLTKVREELKKTKNVTIEEKQLAINLQIAELRKVLK